MVWRLVRNKLESYSFLGVADGNRDFLVGLRSLALLYPLTLAAAKHHAAAQSGRGQSNWRMWIMPPR